VADAYEIALAETRFSQTLEMALQQTSSKLRGTVSEKAITGAKLASPIQQIEAVQMKAVTGRFADKNFGNNSYTRRWVSPTDYVGDTLIDTFDLLKTQIDPKGETISSWAAACSRAFDDSIIANATGPNQIGTDANSLSTENFDTANYQVSVDFGGTGSGLLIAKLIEARRIMRHNHVDLEMESPTLAIGSTQEADFLKQSQVVSSEFNKNGGVVENGTVTRLYGCNIVVTERLPITTANTRGCLLYVKSGLVLGVWQDIKTQIAQLFTKEGNPWNVSTVLSHGGTRTRPGKVIQILCHDTVGADITA
jgi:hypothetical protein